MKKISFLFLLSILINQTLLIKKIKTETVENNEIITLKKFFKENVRKTKIKRATESYKSELFEKVLKEIKKVMKNSQFFVCVDRNPRKQLIFILFYDNKKNKIVEIGEDFCSTGNSKRIGHYITPTGLFKNTIKNFDYRALGTENDKGWKGLGKKGSRVWDFGWQKTYDFRHHRKRKIRLLLHATDPVYGEKRLGRPDSKGCVRISSKLNNFLDKFGILDREYENNLNKKMVRRLLRKDRIKTKFSGSWLIIVDSQKW